ICSFGILRLCAIYSQTGEDGQSQIQTNVLELYANSSTSLFIKAFANQDKGHHRLINSATSPDPAEFLEGTFINMSSDKHKANKGNKKNRKNKKKKKGKPRKQSPAASEMQSEPATGPSSTCANAASGEDMFIKVAVDVPPLEYSSSSSSSPVTELISHVSAGASSDKELSSSSNDFRSCSSPSSERSCSASELTDSRCFSKTGGERNRPNDLQSFSLAVSPGGSQEGLLCSDASNDGGFEKVISRKEAQKMKRMQWSRNPTQTMADSVPIITSALTPRARCEITIGHYIKDDCFSGRKKNHKKGKYQKGRSLTNVPKIRFTDGGGEDENLGSSQMTLSSASLHHHVALEAIKENCSSELLPMQGEMEPVVAPVVGDTEEIDSQAPSSDIASSSDHMSNASRVDREEQKKEGNEKTPSTDASEWDKIIPTAAGSCQNAFLTYHSLGKLVPQTCSIDIANGLAQIICPIVENKNLILTDINCSRRYFDSGLIGENWFKLGGQSGSKLTPDDSSTNHPAELLDKRLSTLRHGASVMSKAVVPRASGEAMNYHPDYEFFRSRSL
ncbi:hypothetical protein BS78_01G310900, partial [Paspalum vaginatum]